MLTLITIIAMIISVACGHYGYGPTVSIEDYECPNTTTPLGAVGTRFDRSVRPICSQTYSRNDKTIQDCEDWCRDRDECHAFEFSYAGRGRNECSLYASVGPVTRPDTNTYSKRWRRKRSYDKSGSCALNNEQTLCPAGTTIGTRVEGQWPGEPGTSSGAPLEWLVEEFGRESGDDRKILTIEQCRQECCNTRDEEDDEDTTPENENVCTAFSYEDTVIEQADIRVTPCFLWNELADLDQVTQGGDFIYTTCEITS